MNKKCQQLIAINLKKKKIIIIRNFKNMTEIWKISGRINRIKDIQNRFLRQF